MNSITKDKFKELAALAHKNNVAKGWWEFERDIEEALMLVISELGEAVNAHRSNKWADVDKYDEVITDTWSTARKAGFELWIKDSVGDELADAAIRLLDLLEHFGDTAIALGYWGVIPQRQNATFAAKLRRVVARVPAWADEFDGINAYRSGYVLGSIFAIAEEMEIDLLWHMAEKIAYNETRPPKHGKLY